MRKYHLSGVEHVHMMRHVPRSYDMTRTHVMHQGVNKHVDVVLRCSPKHWKKKKVRVSPVKSEKKKNVVHIRSHASKGYVAVRKVTNEKYEADRRKVVTAYETKYGAPSANNRALIHDMKSQLSAMAKKSADYIDSQLSANKPAVPAAPTARPAPQPLQKPKAEAPLPEFPKLPDEPVSESLLSPETEAILKRGGYKRPKPLSSTNPYASDYLKQASDLEFRSLMASLEKSLDEACGKYVDGEPKSADPQEAAPTENTANDYRYEEYDSAAGSLAESEDDYRAPVDFRLNFADTDEAYSNDDFEPEPPEDTGAFEPALDFREGGGHYIAQDELFEREFDESDDSFAPPTVPKESVNFDISRFFAEDEEEFTPPRTDFDGGDDDFILPDRYPEDREEVVVPQGYDEQEEAPISSNPYRDYADEEEEEYTPPTIFPDDEEDLAPPTVFPDDEEDFVPPTIFPDEEDYVPFEAYSGEDSGYSPAPVSPDRNEYWGDGDYSANVQTTDARSTETFFSRTGGHIRKAIGVIRGSGGNTTSKNDGSVHTNSDVEITYSDRNG